MAHLTSLDFELRPPRQRCVAEILPDNSLIPPDR